MSNYQDYRVRVRVIVKVMNPINAYHNLADDDLPTELIENIESRTVGVMVYHRFSKDFTLLLLSVNRTITRNQQPAPFMLRNLNYCRFSLIHN